MLKLKRNKKKHKKGKGADELFTPEELEKYKQQQAEKSRAQRETEEEGPRADTGHSSNVEENEAAGGSSKDGEASDEWQRFKELTAGVDNVLKKSQGDLGRIKEKSFFQRKASPVVSENRKKPERPAPTYQVPPPEQSWATFEEGSRSIPKTEEQPTPQPAEPKKEEDTITVPEPEESEEDDFPEDHDDGLFDTSYVDVVTSGDIKLVYVPESPTESEKEEDPFDTSIVDKVIAPKIITTKDGKTKKLVSLGCAVDVLTGLLEKPIPVPVIPETGIKKRRVIPQDLLLESDAIPPNEQSLDIVNTDLVSESLLDDEEGIQEVPLPVLCAGAAPVTTVKEENFDEEHTKKIDIEELEKELELTSTVLNASNTLTSDSLQDNFTDHPSLNSTQLDITSNKLPSNTQVDEEDNFDFDPRAGEVQQEDIDDFDFDPRAGESTIDEKKFRKSDLLGEIHGDAHGLVHFPIEPEVDLVATDNPDEIDPFDTSAVDALVPSKAELKILEQELLTCAVTNTPQVPTIPAIPIITKTDIIEKSPATVTTHVLEEDINAELTHRPLTPQQSNNALVETEPEDPFDTSFAENIHPGKTELRILESELITDNIPKADNFQARFEVSTENTAFCTIVAQPATHRVERLDLLEANEEDIAPHKPLTPGQEQATLFPVVDPFDTSLV
jgi:hypothetical protein